MEEVPKITPNQTECTSCGNICLKKTAERYKGICSKCALKGRFALDSFFEWAELTLRIVQGVVVMFLISGLAFALGALVWEGIGVLLAICFAPLGFLMGFFLQEVKLLFDCVFLVFRLWIGR